MSLVEQIKELINQLAEGDESRNKGIASRIKKLYTIYNKEKRLDEKLNEQSTNEIVKALLENYDSIKQYASVNETFELLVEDYNTLLENSDNDVKKKKINDRIFEIHRRTLGNPGASVKNMPLDYIKKIIEEKLDSENGPNREDVINILSQVSKDVTYDSEEYKEFFDDIFMPIIDLEIENNTNNLKNPKIIEILTEIARNYKRNEEYDKSKEICEKGLKLEEFQSTEQYKELQRESEKINKAISLLDNNFEKIVDISEINSAEELIEIIKKYILEGEQEKINYPKKDPTGKTDIVPNPPPPTPPSPPTDGITLEEKCIALFNFLTELKKQNSNVKFSNPSKGKKGTTWDGYLLLPVSGADFTILEGFDEKSHGLYMVKNENIENIDKCASKTEAKQQPGVTNTNHSKLNPKGYEKRLMDKYMELMGLESVEKEYKKNNKTDIKEPQDREEVEKKEVESDDNKKIMPENETEKKEEESEFLEEPSNTEEFEKVDNTQYSLEELNELIKCFDEECKEFEERKAELDSDRKAISDKIEKMKEKLYQGIDENLAEGMAQIIEEQLKILNEQQEEMKRIAKEIERIKEAEKDNREKRERLAKQFKAKLMGGED